MSNDSANKPAATAQPTDKESDKLVGQIIDGRYRLKRFISQGGMGAVYEAEHVTIQQRVAIKVLHQGLLQVPDLVRRFEREAFAIGRIDHPNCIRVSDFGELDDGALYLVMEYLDGVSLADIIDKEGALAPARSLAILRHILRGLAHIHQAQIIHRDIKPENIMLIERDGDSEFAKVLDFGIAKLIGDAQRPEDHDFTQAGIAFGTPTYMSPEQTLGSPVDVRSDLYQATTVFYEMLAGRPPFYSGDKIELMAMQATKPPPPIEDFNPQARIVPQLRSLIDRGLTKRAKDRFQSADEFLTAVGETIQGLGTAPLPPVEPPTATSASSSTAHVLPRPTTKNLKVFAAGGLALLLLALVALLVASSDSGKGDGPSTPESLAGRAAELLERGRPDEALSLLESSSAELESDANALVVYGHAHAVRDHAKEAIAAYTRAVALSPTLTTDQTLRANVEIFFNHKSSFADATPLRIAVVGEAEARKDISARAITKGDGEWRHRALVLAEELGYVADLDLLGLYQLDLLEGRRCKNRLDAVAKLRALGDPRAIPALQRAIVRKGTRGRLRGKPLNTCLVNDAMKAVQFFEALSSTPR